MGFKIITHDGKSHLDEFIATLLIVVAKKEIPESIERISSQRASVMVPSGAFDSDTYVLDCGNCYEPERKLFDHHQDRDLDSTALLVLNYFFPEMKDSEFCKYIELISKVDCRGPRSLEDSELLTESKLYFTYSIKIFLKMFENNPLETIKLAAPVVQDVLEFEQKKKVGIEWLRCDKNVKISNISGVKTLIYLNRPEEDYVKAIRSVDTSFTTEKIDAIYSFDDKDSKCRVLYRTELGEKKLNLSNCKPANSLFNHNNGFLLRFVPAEKDEYIKLISQATN